VATLKLSTPPTRLKACSISICEPGIPRICFSRKLAFGNWPSYICHQVNGSTHANEEINNLPPK